MSNIPTYTGSGGTTTTPSSSAGTAGMFAGSSSGNSVSDQLVAIQTQLKSMSPAQFFAAYDITSTTQALYLSSAGGLNDNAVYLAYYKSLNQQERQQLQSQMVTVGALPAADANGLENSASKAAWESLIGQSAAQGTNVLSYLAQNATGTNSIQNQISANLTRAQQNAVQPIVATVENPTTLSATITAAFETALGYSPDQAQIQSFVSQVQGQDTAYAQAPRTEAQAQINLAHSQESALNKLGPEGIDSVIQAYQAAVSGTKMPGAGTVQGPANGAQPTPGQTNFEPPGSPLAPGTVPAFNASGQVGGATVAPSAQAKTVQTPADPSLGASIGADISHMNFAGAQPGTKTSYDVTSTANPTSFQAGTPGTTPIYGGLYALSAADWKKAQADYAPAKKYATPGAAPSSVQLGAFSAVLQSAYDSNGGSWSKAVASIASGSPFGTAEGTHLSNFGNQVATEVNNQIASLQSQVNNDTVTTKVSAPDATAEANLAAKQSDPTGYYAAQDASWGSVLNKMLSGTPSMYNQSSSDTFTGPVGAQAATAPAAAAPTTVGAGAP